MKGWFRLQKTSKKYKCPSCGNNSLTRVELLDGTMLPEEYGFCDRRNNCGYENLNIPKEFKQDFKPEQIKEEPRQEQRFIAKSVMESTFKKYATNTFVTYLLSKYDKEDVVSAVKNYNIGTGKDGSTVFWYVNKDNQVTSAKKITYLNTGRRDKTRDIIYPYLVKDGFYSCLFGEHLVESNDKVKVVESEKTAIIMSLERPEYIWCATGGANLTKKIIPLNKQIPYTLIPDADFAGTSSFHKRFLELKREGYNVSYRDILNGADLADFVDKMIIGNDIIKKI